MDLISKIKNKSQDIEQQIGILQVMAENERKMHILYAKYVPLFPDLKEFWERLAREETGHAEWVEIFIEKLKKGDCYFDKDRFHLEAMQTFGSSMDKRITEVDGGEVTIVNALSVARDIETALLEQDFFKVFDSDNLTLKSALEYLEVSTKTHLRIVQEMYDKYCPQE